VEEVKKKMGQDIGLPKLPKWAIAWIEADELHPKI
jgi:hypothetical protein